MADFPQPPSHREPFLDRDGNVTRSWYNWFQQLTRTLNEQAKQIAALTP